MFTYTKPQLQKQLEIAKMFLENEKKNKILVQSEDWIPAKEYGEEIRYSHIETANRNIEFYQKKIINLLLQIGGI